jgi:phage terminase large subunit-like protein
MRTQQVTPEQQEKIKSLLKKFERKEPKSLSGSAKDLQYAVKLLEHYQNIEETGGHLVKLFQPGPLSIEHYPRHKAFFDATATHKEVLFRAANRIGKSESGAYATACWATGLYPDWWNGRRFDKATYGWVCGDTNDTVRTILQDKLLGTPQGTGLLPKELIEDVVVRPNTGGTVDMIYVRHQPTGKISRIKFKTYQSGPDSFYGAAPDYVWMDEEPSGKDAQLIWNQCYIRLLTTNGTLIITFTPLMGWTPLVKNFSETAEDLTPSTHD